MNSNYDDFRQLSKLFDNSLDNKMDRTINVENLSTFEKRSLFEDLTSKLEVFFFEEDFIKSTNGKNELYTAYRYTGKHMDLSDEKLNDVITNKKFNQIVDIIDNVEFIRSMNRIQLMANETKNEDVKAFQLRMESIYTADIISLYEKYFIRLSDSKYSVASDEIKVVFKDPSTNPAWAIWFLGAVPLIDVPNKSELVFLPEDERKNYFPKELDENPIVCHASLWKLGNNTTGLLLHTSWCHISATYKWRIDKPYDIASIIFRSSRHPAILAKNFSIVQPSSVNTIIPGNNWF